MASAVDHHLAPCITSHAWNADCSLLAICPNNSEVHIYSRLPGAERWERVHVLTKHDQLVADIQWAPISNRIVTCSHDRNSYVWTQEESSGEWQATLVLLRINRAALAARWSPKENKFAVASGSKTVCVCYYEAENDWWVSKQLKKKHSSSVTSVAWAPDNVLLATTSTDGKCRVFSAYIKGVDSKSDAVSTFGERKFGEQLLELDLGTGWTSGMQWSPSGDQMAFVGHDSTLHLVADVGPAVQSDSISLRGLPLRAVMFLADHLLVGGGYDCQPILFARGSGGQWAYVQSLEEDAKTGFSHPRSPGSSSQVLDAVGRWAANTKGTNGLEPLPPPACTHSNTITTILPVGRNDSGIVNRFSTSGLDGKVVLWAVPDKLLRAPRVDEGDSDTSVVLQ